MSKPVLLFLAHRIPYPPNKGDKIRSFNLLKSLAQDYTVYLGAFVDDENDWQYESELNKYCTEVFLLGISSKRKYTSSSAFFTGEALSLPYYRQLRMQQWVDSKITDKNISRVFIFSSAMAQYVSQEKYQPLHRIIDFVDVDSEKWREYGKRKTWPMSWVYNREARKLLEYDRDIALKFNASVFVSAHESELFKKLAPESEKKIFNINNGVDFHYFDPQLDLENPYPESVPVIAFTGAMDYWANADAVLWFVKKAFPIIKQKVTEVQFYIVGSRPADAVLKLANNDDIHVTGSVEDIRPYILHSSVVVAPMRIARGIQNKVLEAMAMEKPVIATEAAMEGIEPVAGQVVSNNEEIFAQSCIDLLLNGDQQDTGSGGRERVLEDFSWEENLVKLETLLGDIAGRYDDPLNIETSEEVTPQEALP